MLDLLVALRTARTITHFVEDGGLEEAIASVDLSAAQEALRKVNRAQNPRGQVWSAVNHLEGAEQAMARVAKNWRLMYFNDIKYEVAETRHQYVLALLAICYCYLGETALCAEALDKAARGWPSLWDHDRPFRSRLRVATSVPLLLAKVPKAMVTKDGYLGSEVKRIDFTALRSKLDIR